MRATLKISIARIVMRILRACFIINVKSRGCIVWGEFCFEPKEHSELCDCGEKRKSPKICDRAAHFLLKIVILENLNWNEVKFAHIFSEKMAQKYFKNNNIHLKISNLEGLAYLLKTGCQWRLLPEYYGAWQTIFYQFLDLIISEDWHEITSNFCIPYKLWQNLRVWCFY